MTSAVNRQPSELRLKQLRKFATVTLPYETTIWSRKHFPNSKQVLEENDEYLQSDVTSARKVSGLRA